MASKKKLLQAASGASGGGGLDVDDVFNTFVADATGSGSLTVNNGINLSGEGGIVWNKSRNGTANHFILDPNIGSGGYLQPNSNTVVATGANYSFTSTGLTDAYNNYSNNEAVWWTFRKAPKFFDKVTYTGDQVVGRTVSHNLGSTPGMIIIKKLDSLEDWSVWHKDFNVNGSGLTTQFLYLNTNSGNTNTGSGASAVEDVRSATSTTFTIGNDNRVNTNSALYVAYLFAHNNNDGEFGPAGDQDIIKCGSYSTNSSAEASINLGFEPQWIIYRPVNDTTDFKIIDNIRGFMGFTPVSGAYNKALSANQSFAEYDEDGIHITATGFEHVSGFASKDFIYMAIRRGPLAAPTDATKVFAIDDKGSGGSTTDPAYTSNFVTDMALRKRTEVVHQWFNSARLISGSYLKTDGNDAKQPSSQFIYDYNNGYREVSNADTNDISWMWKRAPFYFDVCCYTGTGGSPQNHSHNLGVAPEMMWIKQTDETRDWAVYHKDIPVNNMLYLNTTAALQTGKWASTAPTSSVFTTSGDDRVGGSGHTYINFLFATVAGVSKVGSYTGTASSQNIDCGFSSGSRFVFVKRYDGIDSWYIADSVRGISSGQTDKIIKSNSTDAQFTESDNSADYIAPHSSGFNLPGDSPFNGSGDNFIFYAIA